MIDERIEIGARLKQYSEQNYKSHADFARIFGVSPQALTNYYNGRNVPGGEFLSRLSKLGCDLNWLLTGKASTGNNISQFKTNNSVISDNSSNFTVNGPRNDYEVGQVRKLELEKAMLSKLIENQQKLIDNLEKHIERLERK